MDKTKLIAKIREINSLDNDEKSKLIELLRKQKKYGLVWEDKPEDVEERLRDELPVLKEVKERAIISDDKDAPNHILIEGDNLEALTALSYTHAEKIDVIYIDPPYNTRKKDFKYNDNYVDPCDNYRHSTWLSFMYKRLVLAKSLLSERGVIFIQIDDKEYAPLKLLCDGIFLEVNSIGPFIQNKLNAKNDTLNIQKNHEYILCYRKTIRFEEDEKKKVIPNLLIRSSKKKKIFKTNGKFFYLNDCITTRGEGGTLNARPNLGYSFYYNKMTNHLLPFFDYDIGKAKVCNDEEAVYIENMDLTNKGYIAIRPPKVRGKLGCWTWDYNNAVKNIDLLFAKDTKNRYNIHKRTFVDSSLVENVDGNYFYNEEVESNLKSILNFSTTDGTDEFTNIMGYETDFNNPKNVEMIQYLLSIFPNNSYTLLDFFAGSGTTLHAAMQLNSEDGGHRQCILVTNNENNICEEVTYERNKRVINGYTNQKGEEVAGLTNNNLRYYKTDFVPRKQTNKNKRLLISAATDLLCIKNNVYTEQTMFGGRKLKKSAARYFDDGRTRMLVIYNELTVDAFAEMLRSMDVEGKIWIYVFSNNGYAYKDNFEEVIDKIELCALPAAIYDAYNRVLKPQKRDSNEEQPLADNETINEQGMLNFSEEGGEQ